VTSTLRTARCGPACRVVWQGTERLITAPPLCRSQQIAAHLVARRDALDAMLISLSSTDIRLAWIGWILRTIVWSIRSLVDMAFRGVIVAQRALSREMEFQADLVSVSLTGSDALIQALHCLIGADDAWDRALRFAEKEFKEGRPVRDLFAIQTRIAEQMRVVLGDPSYAGLPQETQTGQGGGRLFKTAFATPPRMWMTHPPNADREENAKRVYIPTTIDNREAWMLFENPEVLREQVTSHMAQGVEYKPVDLEESLAKLDEDYHRIHLDPAYRGVYLGRSVTRYAENMEDLYAPSMSAETALQQLDALYPESLFAELEQLRELQSERSMLEALRTGFLKAPGGVIRRRGEEITMNELPRVIDSVQSDLDTLNASIQDHDRRCRSAHLVAAEQLGDDWAAYLKGLLGVLHYADHTIADLLDAYGWLSNTFAVVTADGKVNRNELDRLVHAGEETYGTLRGVYDRSGEVLLDAALRERLGVNSWPETLEKLELPPPAYQNIGPWLNVVSGWVKGTAQRLEALRLAALEQLLRVERQVAQHVREGSQPEPAPLASQVPVNYNVLLPGRERKRQTKLPWWDRFQLADGLLPSVSRVAVALVIVGAVLFAGGYVGKARVAVFNGLGRAVTVNINKTQVDLAPFGSQLVRVPNRSRYHIRTRTRGGDPVEEFDADADPNIATHIYNIAGAGALVEWTATYGNAVERPPAYLENARWSPTRAEIFFSEPPKSLNTSGSGETRTVLTGLSGEFPLHVLSIVHSDSARHELILKHARWDDIETRYLGNWLVLAYDMPNFQDVLDARLAESPRDPLILRAEQDVVRGDARLTVCERHQQLAAQSPEDPNLQYIAARCIADYEERRRTVMALHERWPTHPWLMVATGYVLAEEGKWSDAVELFDRARTVLPAMGDRLAVDEARMRRVIVADEHANLSDLVQTSEWLKFVSDLEAGDGIESGPLLAYPALARGNLAGALASSGGATGGEPDPRVLRLVAASDGASADLRERALALPLDAGLDRETFWPTLALAALGKRDLQPYFPILTEQMQDDAPTMRHAFETLRSPRADADFEKELVGLDPYQRGLLYGAAAVLRGRNCPASWRAAARELLFVSERPFFGPP
jgi:hypothetical protein